MRRITPLRDRFFKKVSLADLSECWLWTGVKYRNGYGNIYVNEKKKKISAHRISYDLFWGEIPNGFYVLHKCDTPACVNPTHLFLGTAQDNANDCINKDRKLRGSAHQNSKVIEKDVALIRKLYGDGMLQKDIAKKFDITRENVGYIVRRKTWTHI